MQSYIFLHRWDNSISLVTYGVKSGSAGDVLTRSVNKMDSTVKRGDIFYADLSAVVGSEQGGTRPVLIVQNDTGN